MDLSVVQMTACECLWRNLQHSKEPAEELKEAKSLPLPVAQRRIANYVLALPHSALAALVSPELHRRGALDSGVIARWGDLTHASARYDANVAAMKTHGETRISQMSGWETSSNASSYFGVSRDSSPTGDADPEKTPSC